LTESDVLEGDFATDRRQRTAGGGDDPKSVSWRDATIG
jgi:hypothetical protein